MNRETFIDNDKTILNTDFYFHLLSCENENTDLRQALISIRDFSKLNLGLAEENKQDSVPKYVIKDILQIIEDKPKKIEKIETRSCCGYTNIIDIDEKGEHHLTTNRKDINIYIPKINELIEQVNYLLEKSDKE